MLSYKLVCIIYKTNGLLGFTLNKSKDIQDSIQTIHKQVYLLE